MPPAIIVLTGASGAGKSTLVSGLQQSGVAGVAAISCDRVKLDLPDNSPEGATLEYWIRRMSEDSQTKVAVIDTQVRPSCAREVFVRMGVRVGRVVLVDCMYAERHERLRVRGQPELVNSQMDCWAAYLRGQADALDLQVIDTTRAEVAECVSRLVGLASEVLGGWTGEDP
jgi:dephospho-CoA kinase